MKMSKEDYMEQFNAFMKDEYDNLQIKPNGMYGTMAFFKVKEREFKDKLRAEGYEIK
jgi:hypothetical protein